MRKDMCIQRLPCFLYESHVNDASIIDQAENELLLQLSNLFEVLPLHIYDTPETECLLDFGLNDLRPRVNIQLHQANIFRLWKVAFKLKFF